MNMFFLPTGKGIVPAAPRNLLGAFENPINISYNDIKISQYYSILLRINLWHKFVDNNM